MKLTQHDRILDYIKTFGSITTLDAFRDLGITKLTTKISEMRAAGIDITGTPEIAENRYGEKCHFNRYTLKDDNLEMNTEKIKNKVKLGLPLNKRERAYYLLFIATLEEAKELLKAENSGDKNEAQLLHRD